MSVIEHVHEQPQQPAARAALQGWLKTGLLFGLALYFVYNILSGNLANYINQRFAWLSYVAVVLFVLLGAASLLELLRRDAHEHHDHEGHEHHDHDHDHDHSSVSWVALAVVAVPLVLGTLIPSQPLGATAIDGSISLSGATVTTATTFTTNPLEWNVLDWLRAFNASDDIQSFNGRQADVVGFVYREATFPDEKLMVARFTVSCCVADAAAIGLPIVWPEASSIPQDTWIRVQGTFQVGEFRGDTVPLLIAESIEEVPQPEHPYLYP
ncbi:MAG: TIGR03943 family protein [Anaerolineae bacterium]|nr:TIGR03943 family protein [Anaerolineae bacterium]